MTTQQDALIWLRVALDNPTINFRDGQWEAIDQLVNKRGRVLCVQRTGWGKSMVYFVAAKLMREQGAGPTLIVSPLLALMRNQIAAANRLKLRAETINSTNADDWHAVRQRLLNDEIDLLLISPERLANDDFVTNTLLPIAERIGLLVIDEAHCISDWGHDFRPDYRRIGQILRLLPKNIAVLATTATANHRVVEDVSNQLGGGVLVQRGPLIRESLALQTMRLANPAQRLAWMADHIPKLPGSGIVYTLTTRDADRVAYWLRENDIEAHAYHGGRPDEERQSLEEALLGNKIKCLVATTALGMGYDKPDLGFVIHYQTPGSVVFYYQQVGRAGRAIDEAFGVLLSGDEENEINAFFRDTAFPPEWQIERILEALEACEDDGMTVRELEHEVNLRQTQIEKVLKLLVVEDKAPVVKIDSRWSRTAQPFKLDKKRIEHLTHQREQEWGEMQAYIEGQQCLMEFLATALDDPLAQPCGKCAVCLGEPVVPIAISEKRLIKAQRFVRQSEMLLELKKQWDVSAIPTYAAQFSWNKANIPLNLRGEPGRILSRWGEPVWGERVTKGKAVGHFGDDLVDASVELIKARWKMTPMPAWVTCIPSSRHPDLVPDFSKRLAAALGIPFRPVIIKTRHTEEQKEMENRYHQCHNLDGAFFVKAEKLEIAGPVLLVDDVFDSGWTMTIATALLRQAGSGPVYPYALATTTAK
jgi:ATP-dependent DNA helicase RecQ